MIGPDSSAVQRRKKLVEDALVGKREAYVKARDNLIQLNETLQEIKQKRKLKSDALKEFRRKKKDAMHKYIESHVQIAYARADLMLLRDNKDSVFDSQENVPLPSISSYLVLLMHFL